MMIIELNNKCEKDVFQNTSNKIFHSRKESEIVRNASQCSNQRFLLVATAVLVSPVPTAMQVVCLSILLSYFSWLDIMSNGKLSDFFSSFNKIYCAIPCRKTMQVQCLSFLSDPGPIIVYACQ